MPGTLVYTPPRGNEHETKIRARDQNCRGPLTTGSLCLISSKSSLHAPTKALSVLSTTPLLLDNITRIYILRVIVCLIFRVMHNINFPDHHTAVNVFTYNQHNIYTSKYISITVFFCLSACFSLPAAGRSSCSRLCGTQDAGPDPARKFGPSPRSVARALGVQSSKSARGEISST